MALNDLTNGMFEILGGFALWQNVRRIRQDRKLAGVDWKVTGFFTSWGFWNLWYYPSLHQWFSFMGGVNIVIANTFWLFYAIKYRNVR